MSDPGPIGEFARHLASVLNLNKYNFAVQLLHLAVCQRTNRARETVFENNYWSLLRVIQQVIERPAIYDRLKCHSHLPSFDINIED
jgi:hypothetical protein